MDNLQGNLNETKMTNEEKEKIKKEQKQKDLEEAFNQKEEFVKYSKAENMIKENVKGQDEAIRRILTAIYRSYEEDDKQEPTVILLVGPTGVGKTYIIKQILNILNVPYAFENAPDFTKAGYEGKDINDIFYKLVSNAKDYKAISKGIVFVDEIDKLVGFAKDDVGGEAVYESLLAPLDGRVIDVIPPKTMKARSRSVQLNTINTIFVMAGAFDGLDKIREQRLKKKNNIGFNNNHEEENEKEQDTNYIKADIIRYGILPEFVGRINNIVELQPHSKETLISIIRDAKDSKLRRYVSLFKNKHDIDIDFYDDFYSDVADKANSMGTGAREIVTVINKVFDQIFTDVYRMDYSNKICVLQPGIVKDNSKYIWKEK